MPRSLKTHVRPGVGERLREARVLAGLTQRQLSFDGCTAAYISRLEADARTPSLQLLHELAGRLGCDPGWLATGVQPDENDLRAQLRAVTVERDALQRRLERIAKIAGPGR
ncbi:MAG TPA: helix-turn-helix transcriptional regulator [Gaiellaceae bacterium]|jgi:transcriptional regulator with XRE-family HTH domain|nr:helix-turn-helix transcriptional regulator [Gaiellaceae bacterium]